MGIVSTWTAGTTTGAQMATAHNALANAANTVGQYSHNASVALTTTPSAISVSTNDTQAGGISHSTSTNTSRFTATVAGIYLFTVQPQISHLTTGTGTATFWQRLNGTTPITDSAAIFKMGAIAGSGVLNIVVAVPMAVSDYIEVMAVASAASEHEITFTASSGTGATAIPASPAIIITATALPV